MFSSLAVKVFLTAVVTSKYDFLYLDEWVQFHQRIGFDNINLIDTTTDSNIINYSNSFPDEITLMSWTESSSIHISDILNTFSQNFDNQPIWNAFICLDEFIVLKTNSTIRDLITEVASDGGALGLETLLFGNNGHEIYPTDPVVKRFTQRSSTPHSIVKTIVYMPDIHYWTNSSRPVLREGKKFHTVHGSDHAAMIHKYPIKSIQEFNWNQQHNMDKLMEYLNICGEFSVFSSTVVSDAVFLVDGLPTAFEGGPDLSKLFSDVTDTSAWDQFTLTAVKPPITPPVNYDAFNRLFTYNYNDDEDSIHQSLHTNSDILLRIPVQIVHGPHGAADLDNIRELMIYKQPYIPLQISTFCMDHLLADLCVPLIHVVVSNLRVKYGISIEQEAADYQNKIFNYYIENTREEKVHIVKNQIILENHRDECYAVRREQSQSDSSSSPTNTSTNSGAFQTRFNTTVKTVMYVIHHDDVSERIIYHNLTANGTYVLNGNVRPVRIASSVFFESVIYRDVLPYRYRKEWANVDYVGISTYKTISIHAALCTHELERMLNVAERDGYDVIPLVRSPSPLMWQAVYSHGRLFRKAWYLLLEELGYSRDVILKYEQIPGFYRNTMYIRPAWLVRLSQFMSRAIDTVLMNSTVHSALSQKAKYGAQNGPAVPLKIFNSTFYQLFPFVFERLPVFFLAVEGAKICQGNEDCLSNVAGGNYA